MRISIITIHAMHNPGSVFQAYALEKYLSSQNHNVQIIDYRPSYFYSEGSALKLYLKKLMYFKKYKNRAYKFDSFIKENMTLTEPFNNYEELCKSKLDSDIFIVGSDQLWNSDFECGKDDAFYLEFVNNGKKISYSTSVGKAKIDHFNRTILLEKLRYFDSISVREKSSAVQMTKMLNRKVEWVCDPVFLLSASDYRKFIIHTPLMDAPFAMVYLSPKSDALDKIVEYYRQKGLKIVLLGGYTKRCYCDVHIKDAGPVDFLSYIYHAEVVISTSFHATSFCHIFHKNFISIVPERNGERILSLLNKSDLTYRAVVSDQISYEDLDRIIDWGIVDKKLEDYINNSKAYLQKVLS